MEKLRFGRMAQTSYSWVVVSAFSSIALAIVTLLGWISQTRELVQLDRAVAPLTTNEALCFLLGGLALLTKRRSQRTVASVASLLIMTVGLLTLAQYLVIGSLGIDQLLLPDFLQLAGAPGRMAPNSALAFFFVGLGLCFIHGANFSKDALVTGIVMALIGLSIGGLGLYGRLFELESAYAWGDRMTEMSPQAALGLVILASGVVSLGWGRYSLGKASVTELSNGIRIISATGIALLAVISSTIGTLTLYDLLQENIRKNTYEQLQLKAMLLREQLFKTRSTALQISNAPRSIAPSEDFRRNPRLSSAAYQENLKVLEGARTLMPDVAGVTRVFIGSNHRIRHGLRIPAMFLRTRVGNGVALSFPFNATEGRFFVLRAPIKNAAGATIASDYYLISTARIESTLSQNLSLGSRGLLALAAERGRRLKVFHLARGNVRLVPVRRDVNLMRTAYRRSQRGSSGYLKTRVSEPSNAIVFYAPVRSAPWALLLRMDMSELETQLDDGLVRATTVVLALSLVGTAFFYFFIRTFLGHVVGLQGELKETAIALEDELHAREEAERLARQQAMEKQSIVDNAGDGIITIDLYGRILTFNRRAEELFGYAPSEVSNRRIDLIMPALYSEWDEIKRLPSRGSDARSGKTVEVQGRRKDGSTIALELSLAALRSEGVVMFTAIVHDLSEHKRSKERLESSVREKEMLLKEIHHRVKNNLQIISSIFSLQCRRTEDSNVLGILKESQTRIQSIALLHETLYRTQDLSRIDMQNYLSELARNLVRSYDGEGKFKVEVKGEGDTFVEIDRAIPCGLIVNELLTNCFKHAFPSQRGENDKRVEVLIKRIPGTKLQLTVRDNGIGISGEVESLHTRSLGFRLVRTLVQQLRGEMSVSVENGTNFSFVFS